MKKPFILLLFLLLSLAAEATHFRYGHISWTRQPGTRTVNLKLSIAWRAGYGDFESFTFYFGDGSSQYISSLPIITTAAGINIGELSITKSYSSDGPFTAYFESGDRISTLQGAAADASFKVSTTVCLTGNNNGSPVNLSPQILKLPRLSNAQLQLNALDSDGSTVSFSQTNIAGAGYSYTPPIYAGNTLTVSSTGVVNWNTSTIPIGYMWVLRVKFSDGCAESEADYIVEIVDGTCTSCTDKVLGNFTDNDRFCATQYLCNNLIVKVAQPDPKGKIIRGDVANVTYRALIGESINTTAKSFDCPFVDLQLNDATTAEYFKHAKTLSYLEYQDGRSPFDRNRTYFYPTDTITRATVLKVLLEAWNTDENAISGTSPFSDVTTAHPFYKYIKKAHELGIIIGSGGLFYPNIGCTREDAFLMLYRILTSTSITKPTLAQINAGFFIPNTFRPDNLGVGIGNDRGNFNHYTKTSFAIDGTVPLVFAHSYNSYTTELPDSLFNNPLGRGWTHSFNCYVLTYGESTDPNRRRIVHYPDGTLHYYKENSSSIWGPESIGVYDTMVQGSGFIEITTPSKVVYRFESQAGKAGKYMLIKSIKDRNNNTLTFTNELGDGLYPRLKSVADPAGRTLNFVYKTSTNWLTEVNLSGVGVFNGRKITFDYHIPIDGDGYPDLKEYKEPDLNGTLKTTTYGYFMYTDSTAHLLKTITLPKGNVIDNTYQQRKLTSSRTMNGANVVQKMDVNLTPNYTGTVSSSSSVVKTTDENGLQKTTNYNHNTNGLPTQVTTTGTQPLNLGMDYGNSNDPTAVTRLTQNSTGVRIQYYSTPPYNVQLIKTAKAPGDSITQSFTYNGFNDVLTSTNGRGFTTTFEYNATGNLTKITDPRGKNTLISRRTDGLVNTVTTPTGIQTTFGYNTYGNLTSTSVANGANPPIATSAVYDALSRLVTTTDPRSKQTTYEYYANDLLKKTTAPMSVATNYNYDANDNLTTITNAKGFATTMSYNTQTDQLISRSFGGKTESFTYYTDGALKTYTNKRGNVFTFTYDASGRVKTDSYATYDYNPDGTLNTISNTSNGRNYVLDYDYDLLKRISKTTLDGRAVQYAYDNNNNLTTLTYPDGKTVTYTYDNNDRLSTVTDWASRTTTYSYDDDGKLLNYTLPNGMKCIYTYDAAGRMTGMRNEKTGAVVLNSYTYVLDAAGNHLEENIIEPYSAAVSLTAGTTNYTTDNANQQTNASSTVGGSNTYGFDNNGAITTQAGQTLTYDTRDNLLTGYGNSYYYDGNETRRAKTGKRYIINELTNSVIAETDDAGNYQYYYVYGPTGLLYRQSAGGTPEFYHYDFRGSTIATTNAAQTVVRQYQYDAFGKILQQTPTTDDNPFRYVGQHGVQFENANLYFMRARYYDPNTGRFVSEDPIWATNLYPYADNNPVMMVDAMGKKSIEAEISISAAASVTGGASYSIKLDELGNYAVYKKYSGGAGANISAEITPSFTISSKNIEDFENSTESFIEGSIDVLAGSIGFSKTDDGTYCGNGDVGVAVGGRAVLGGAVCYNNQSKEASVTFYGSLGASAMPFKFGGGITETNVVAKGKIDRRAAKLIVNSAIYGPKSVILKQLAEIISNQVKGKNK